MISYKALKGLLIFLVLAPLVAIPVMKSFNMPSEILGGFFVLMGYVVVLTLLKAENFKLSALFGISFLYALLSTFLYGGKSTHRGVPFKNYSYFNISGDWIHHTVEFLYLMIIILLIAETYKARKSIPIHF